MADRDTVRGFHPDHHNRLKRGRGQKVGRIFSKIRQRQFITIHRDRGNGFSTEVWNMTVLAWSAQDTVTQNSINYFSIAYIKLKFLYRHHYLNKTLKAHVVFAGQGSQRGKFNSLPGTFPATAFWGKNKQKTLQYLSCHCWSAEGRV